MISIYLQTTADMKRTVLILGHFVFYGDYKNQRSLKEYMELAGDYLLEVTFLKILQSSASLINP